MRNDHLFLGTMLVCVDMRKWSDIYSRMVSYAQCTWSDLL